MSLHDDNSNDIWFQQAALDGSGFGFIAYGAHMTLYFMAFPLIWKQRSSRPIYAYATMAYISILFALGTITNFSDMHYVEEQFVDTRDKFPGGPVAFELTMNRVKGLCAYMVNTWFTDAMMVYRFAIVFQCKWWIVAIPTALFLTSIAFSIVTLVLMLGPSESYITASKYSTVYFTVSVGTTVFLTLAIITRLLRTRRRIARVMEHDIPEYLTVSAMLVESAFIYSVFALPHAVLNALNNPAQLLTFHIVGQVQSIAPLLIVFRVAQRRAWTRAIGIAAESLANSDVNISSHIDACRGQSLSPSDHTTTRSIGLDLSRTNTQDGKCLGIKFAERPPSRHSKAMEGEGARNSSDSAETYISPDRQRVNGAEGDD